MCKQIRTVPKIYIYDIIDSQLQEVAKNANVKLLLLLLLELKNYLFC